MLESIYSMSWTKPTQQLRVTCPSDNYFYKEQITNPKITNCWPSVCDRLTLLEEIDIHKDIEIEHIPKLRQSIRAVEVLRASIALSKRNIELSKRNIDLFSVKEIVASEKNIKVSEKSIKTSPVFQKSAKKIEKNQDSGKEVEKKQASARKIEKSQDLVKKTEPTIPKSSGVANALLTSVSTNFQPRRSRTPNKDEDKTKLEVDFALDYSFQANEEFVNEFDGTERTFKAVIKDKQLQMVFGGDKNIKVSKPTEVFSCQQYDRLLTSGNARVDIFVNGENFLSNDGLKQNANEKVKLKGYMRDINTLRIINKKEKYDFIRKQLKPGGKASKGDKEEFLDQAKAERAA